MIRWFLATVFVFYASAIAGHVYGEGNFLPPVDLDKAGVEAYEPGLIRIRFNPAVGHGLAEKMMQKSADGIVKTGFPAFDVLSKQHMLVEARPLLDAVYQASPELLQYRARHEAHGLHLWYEFQTLAKDEDIVSAVRAYQELTEVEVAEPVYRIRLVEPDVNAMHPLQDNGQDGPFSVAPHAGWIPNDPDYASNQWHFNNTGQVIGGVAGLPGADIGMQGAWSIQKGSTSVIVAVLDSGVQHDHPDLAGNMWSGTGYNFVDDSPVIVPGSHGTHVAGTVAAVSNNGTGVAGIAGGSGSGNGVRIMSLQILRGGDSGGIMAAFVFAADHGAAITQNSWGYEEAGVYNQSDLDGIDYFNANGGGSVLSGGLSVFAAGNSNSQGDWYPAYYSGTFSVAATTNQDVKASFSNYGSWIDISAPGTWVYSTSSNSTYGFMSGTSTACPHVSGAAALVVSQAPDQLSAAQVASILKSTSDNIDGLNPSFSGLLGAGRLNAHNALMQLTGTPPPVQNPAWMTSTAIGDDKISLAWQKNSSNDAVMVAWNHDGNFGSPASGSAYNPGQTIPGGGNIIYRGSGTSFVHEGLSMNIPYYYKAWSYNAGNDYSDGIVSSARIAVTYTVEASAGHGGSISPSGSRVVNQGQNILFTMTPDQGHMISDVLVDGSSVGAVAFYQFSDVESNHTIHAAFKAQSPPTIVATAGKGGIISPSGDVGVKHGDDQLFTFTPDVGYVIQEVTVDDISVGSPPSYLFSNVTSDHTIGVTFVASEHIITANTTSGGTIDPAGLVIVPNGSDMTFFITPDEGHVISDVSVNGWRIGPVSSFMFQHVTSNQSIHVVFRPKTYTIRADAGSGGSISPEGQVMVTHGSDQTFSITPYAGYHIADVVADQVSIGPTVSHTFFNVKQDHEVEAYFSLNHYIIDVYASPGGLVSPTGQVTVSHGHDVRIDISAAEGYVIDAVLVDGEPVIVDEVLLLSAVASDRNVWISFRPLTFVISATAGAGGTITPTGEVMLTMADQQTFFVIPDHGHHIVDVLIDEISIGAVASYTFSDVLSDRNIHAHFGLNTYTLSATASEGGSVSPTASLVAVYGDTITYYFIPDQGYHIVDVLIDGESVGSVMSYTFADVTADHHIHAVFAVNTYTITASSTEGGEIIPEGEVVAAYGSSMLFSIMQQESYHVADVLVDGLSIGAVFEYVFEEVKQNHTIHAIFEADPEPLNEVVFMVDMQYAEGFIPSSDELYLTGSFYGWEGPGLLLNAKSGQADKSPMVFYGYLELPAGSYAYTYYLNAFPAGAEWEGPVYRTLTVPDTLQTYDVFGYRTDPTSLPLLGDNVIVSVYPNPANELVNITGSVDISQIFLVDMYGRTLLSEAPATNRHQLDLSGVPTGIYLIRVYTRDHGQRTIRLIRK